MLVASRITTSILVMRFHEGVQYATATGPERIMCASKFLFRALGSPKREGTLLELRKVRTTADRCQDRSSDRQDVPQVRAHRCVLISGIQRPCQLCRWQHRPWPGPSRRPESPGWGTRPERTGR